MDNLVYMLTTDASPSDISDKIKELLYVKAAERVEAMKPYVAASVFGGEEYDDEGDE